MADGQLYHILHHLRGLVRAGENAHLSDAALLEQFLTRRDEAAFETLLRRHGPMVLNVCRRVLPDPHDAEDAFQATFLVFVRRAGSIARRELLGNWLYGVAYHTARAARTAAGRRRAKEARAVPRCEPPDEDPWRDLLPLLDQELSRLPDKYRIPVILCDLEGKSRREAARLLGLPEGTLSSRLARARTTLARRLRGRGVAVTGAALIVALGRPAAAAALPPHLLSTTLKAGTGVLAGQAVAAGVVSAHVAALCEGVLKTMFLTKLKSATAVLLAGSVLALGVGQVVSRPLWAGDPVPQQAPRGAAPDQPQPGTASASYAVKYLRAPDLVAGLSFWLQKDPSVRVRVDDRTNTVLLSGPSEGVEALLKAYRQADRPPAKPNAAPAADLTERVQRLERQLQQWETRLKEVEKAVQQWRRERVKQDLDKQVEKDVQDLTERMRRLDNEVSNKARTGRSLPERVQELERQMRQWEQKMKERPPEPRRGS